MPYFIDLLWSKLFCCSEQALPLLRRVNSPHLGLMLDPLHLVRGGGSLSQVASLNQADICFAQVCDAPSIKPDGVDASTEAKSMRFYPGEAEDNNTEQGQ